MSDDTTWYARPGFPHSDKPEQGLPGLAAVFARRRERIAREEAERSTEQETG